MAAGGASAETRDILRPLLPALFRLNEDLRPEPDLVRAWPKVGDFARDPFSVKLTLKRANWSDGRPITSRDVRFSAEKLRAGPTGYRYRYLSRVDVLGPRTFRLHFDRPLRRWWSLFSLDDMVLPAHAYSSKWSDGPTVSGGPFTFASWTKGLDIKLQRNLHYFGDRAQLKMLDVLFVPNDETRLQLLRNGEIDAFFSEGDANMGRRARAYGFLRTERSLDGRGRASGVWGPTWLEVNLDKTRLGAGLRQAIVEAIDDDLVAELLEDSGRPMDAIPPSFGAPATGQPWSDRGDIAKAKRLVSSSQLRLGFETGPSGNIAGFMHFRLLDAGITAELAGVEPKTFERSWVVAGPAPAIVRVRRGADAPDAESYSALSSQPGSGPVDDSVVGAETTGASEGIVTGLDAAAWTRAEVGLARAATTAPLAQIRTWIVGRVGVFGPKPTGTSEGPFAHAASWRVEPTR